MAEEETASLRNEVIRLNSIIDVLLESNRQLKNVLAFYQQTAILPANLFDGNPQQPEGIEIHQQPTNNRMEGMKNNNSRTPSSIEETKNFPQGIQTGQDKANNVQRLMHSEKDGVNNVVRPKHLKNDGVNNVQDDMHLQKDGANNVLRDMHSEKDGVNNNQRLMHSEKDGVNNVQDGIPFQKDGVNDVQRHLITTDNRVNKEQQHTCVNDSGVNSVQNPVDKTNKEVKPVRYQNLLGLLREINARATWQSTENTALILIRLETSPKQSIKDLQKLTGLSEDGMVKRIMAMKKFGLITRGIGRQLLLTEKAIAILDQAREP